jgi:hypothetical protein
LHPKQKQQIVSPPKLQTDFIIARLARKSMNNETAQNYLNSFEREISKKLTKSSVANVSISALWNQIKDNDQIEKSTMIELFQLRYEQSKLLQWQNQFNDSFVILFDTLKTSSSVITSLSTECKDIWSKIVLKLAKYTVISPNVPDSSKWAYQLNSFLDSINEKGLKMNLNLDHLDLNEAELLSSRLLFFNAKQNDQMGKNWHSLAAWCYRWSMKRCPSETEILPDLDERSLDLLRYAVEGYFKYLQLDASCTEEIVVTTTLRLTQILSKHWKVLRDPIEDGFASTPIGLWKTIILQLFALLGHPQTYVRQCIGELLHKIGQQTPHLVLYPAVSGALVDDTNKSTHLKLFSSFSQDMEQKGTDDKVCEIVGDNLIEIEDNLLGKSNELGELPVDAQINLNESGNYLWAKNQPEVHRLRNDSFDDLFFASESKESDKLHSFHHSKSDCHRALLSSLPSDLVVQVKRFVVECERITLLWDELWLATLLSKFGEMKRIVQSLEQDVLALNSTKANLAPKEMDRLMMNKHDQAFKPIISLLEQANAITSRAPETPHEQWFQKTHSNNLVNLIQSLRCPLDAAQPSRQLAMYQRMIQMLQSKPAHIYPSMSSSANVKSQLFLDLISPVLANMKSTKIPIPGANSVDSRHCVQIDRIHRTCQTLQAKTKPKKLAFYGSNGKMYGFLLKGEDNLQLDERIMQLLKTVNQMFVSYAKKLGGSERHNWRSMRSRHYSVTPISSRSGLIQWVNGSSLFTLYNRHMAYLKIEATTRAQATQEDDAVASKPPTKSIALQNPSEIFNRKLEAKGLKIGNRSKWPIATLVEVLQELSAETPSELIVNELWCASNQIHEYWLSRKRFVQSNAIMCMVGYLIGLGDRHLDNLLLDLTTGEIIHIDYNICFERGRLLCVPERVPCRLTPNIVRAFGMTGVDGAFRSTCVDVLEVLRLGRETFLTLLEASLDESTFERSSQLPFADSVLPSKADHSWYQIWRRIKMKLDGRDPDETRRSSPAEQVQFILTQAIDCKNLARMFEGWTAWV